MTDRSPARWLRGAARRPLLALLMLALPMLMTSPALAAGDADVAHLRAPASRGSCQGKKKTVRPQRMKILPPKGLLADGRGFRFDAGTLTIVQENGSRQAAAPGRYVLGDGRTVVVGAKGKVLRVEEKGAAKGKRRGKKGSWKGQKVHTIGKGTFKVGPFKSKKGKRKGKAKPKAPAGK